MEVVVVRTLFTVLVCCGIALNGVGQVSLRPIDKADSLLAKSSKPMLVLVSAPWCKWCEKFKQQVLMDEMLAGLDDRWYFFELNDESPSDVEFLGNTYKSSAKDHHGLTLALNGENRLTLPAIFILNESGEVMFEHRGYLNAESLHAVLTSTQ